MNRKLLAAALAAAMCGTAQAATSLGLSGYGVRSIYAIDTLGGLGEEASAVTYARDRNSLFMVGDEGLGVVELSRTGATLGTMTFSGGTNLGWPTTSTNRDAEGLAYLGGGTLVVAEERLQDLFRFGFTAGGTVNLANAPYVSIGATTGNTGTEGVAYDSRNGGSFISVKQSLPQDILAGTVTFDVAGGVSGMTQLFDPALLGLASLSDVASLAGVDAFAGTSAADNLLILSLDSNKLLEVTRAGQILGELNLAGITTQAIEGVTVDENGIIYLVAESNSLALNSQLIELAPVPEPSTWALMLAGLGVLGFSARRRARTTHA